MVGEQQRAAQTPRLAAVLAVGVVVPVAYAIGIGFLRRPFEDDWAYLRIARGYLDTGAITSIGWNDLTLLGQLYVSRALEPLTGTSVAALRLQAVVFGIGLAVLVIAAARRWARVASWQFITAFSLVLPAFVLYSLTYMADIPTTFFIVLAACCGMAAADRAAAGGNPLPWRAVGVAAAVAAFSYRQTGLAALLGLALVVPWRSLERRSRLLHAAVFLGGLVLVGAIGAWSPLREETTLVDFSQPVSGALLVVQALMTVALALWPYVLRLRRPDIASPTARLVAAAAAGVTVLAGLVVWRRRGFVLSGDLVQFHGGNPMTGFSRPASFFDLLAVLLCVAAIVVSALLAYRVVLVLLAPGASHESTEARTPWATARRFVAAMTPAQRVAGSVGAVQLGGVLFLALGEARPVDRYLLPFMLLAPLALPAAALAYAPLSLRGGYFAAAIAVAVFSALYVVDTVSWTEQRWRIAEELVAGGVPAEEIEAGLDFDGFQRDGRSRPSSLLPNDWREAMQFAFPGFAPCVEVTLEPRSGDRPVETIAFWRVPGVLRGDLYAFAVPGATCSAAGA